MRATNIRRLLKAIWADPRGRRWLVLLSTMRDTDVDVATAEGRVVEVGSHDELMAAGGDYRDLHMSQFRGDATRAVTP
jgi:ABC-type transport system involved in Fe-S cluster assembly fused permease/ATPase subunit